ncbi:MAG: hypothetical protein JXA21_20705 [Anaerolineae bacterium]|nr:hypothetical protein [Anaerolineae bacterium]
MDLYARIESSEAQLSCALEQVGVPYTNQQSAQLVIKKGKVVGYVLAYSWEATGAKDIQRLLGVVKQAGGYGAVKRETVAGRATITLEVSFSF